MSAARVCRQLTEGRILLQKWLRFMEQLIDDSAISTSYSPMSGGSTCTSKTTMRLTCGYCFEKPLDAEIFRAHFDPKRATHAHAMSV
jgi:hypothetical protein